MKKTVRPNIVLLIEGRIFITLAVGLPFYMLWLGVSETIEAVIYPNLIYMLVGFVLIFAITLFGFHYFWQLCWNKLVITDCAIVWRCLFFKPIVIKFEDLKYIEIRTFSENNGNVAAKYNKNGGTDYLLMSTELLPSTRVDKIRSKGNLIRFLISDSEGKRLYEYMPKPYNSYFYKYTVSVFKPRKKSKSKSFKDKNVQIVSKKEIQKPSLKKMKRRKRNLENRKPKC